MCLESRHLVAGYCVCLENNKKPNQVQKLLIEKYIPVFKSFLRRGPHAKVVHYFVKTDLLVLSSGLGLEYGLTPGQLRPIGESETK